jgi:hypothetical protein
MASPGSIAYPDRFYAAAAYAGFGAASPSSSSAAISRFQNDVALLLYGLHQQVTHAPAPIQALPPRGVSLCVRCRLPESGVADLGFFSFSFSGHGGALQRAQAQGVEPRGAEQMDQVRNSPPPPDPYRSNLLIPPRVLQIVSILSCVRASV